MKRTLARSVSLLGVVAATWSVVAEAEASTGPGFGPREFAGANWGGYVSFGTFTTASASWTEPRVRCNSPTDLFAPWVGIDGDGSSTVEQVGVATDCSSGSPVYRAWYETFPAAAVYYSDPISAGDHITARVTRIGSNDYRYTVSDTTRGWSRTSTGSVNTQHSSAEAVVESPTDSYPTITGGVRFTDVEFDGESLAHTKPTKVDADDHGTHTWRPGPISSGGFTVSRH
jgi:peptidase A4-like protein